MVFLPTETFKLIIDYAGHNYQQKHKLMMRGVMEVLDSLPEDWLADAIECGYFYEEEYGGGNIDQLWDEYIKPENWEYHSTLEEWMEMLSDCEEHEINLLEFRPFFHRPYYFAPAFWIEISERQKIFSIRKHHDNLDNQQKALDSIA